jgi:hypothetical protein
MKVLIQVQKRGRSSYPEWDTSCVLFSGRWVVVQFEKSPPGISRV